MKLRVLMCLFLVLIIVSDVTIVAATNAANVTTVEATNIGIKTILFEYVVNITMYGHARYFAASGTLRAPVGHVNIDGYQFRVNRTLAASWGTETPRQNVFSFVVNRGINTIYLGYTHGLDRRWLPPCCDDPAGHFYYRTTHVISEPLRLPRFQIYRNNTLLTYGTGLGIHIVNLPAPPILINASHALNFTLASAMAIPTMTIDIVDDIMLIIGKHIKCGITKFAIRAALLKFTAKGVAVTVAITAISYLFIEFADDIYYSIFASIPELHPGDTVFHESEIHRVMEIINTHFPVTHATAYAIEQSIRQQVDAFGMILISEVMTILKRKHEEIIRDIYQETPGFFPTEIIVNKEQVPEIMELIDGYFPVEFPIRNIIEQAIYREIYRDEFHEIYFHEIIDIIEQEQNIFIPEFPVKTPEEQYEYINRLIDKVIYEDVFIPIYATPFIFPGIPATPPIPKTPKRPDEKIHTFPFYSIFVDPLASVIGITMAHLFTAMMIIGAIISIGATWGTIGAIFAGFIGTITTAYFGLTSWLIPVFLIVLLIIYANIRIKGGVGKH